MNTDQNMSKPTTLPEINERLKALSGSFFEQGLVLLECKEAYEAIFPLTRLGASGGNKPAREHSLLSFVGHAAGLTKKSSVSVGRRILAARSVHLTNRRLVLNTSAANDLKFLISLRHLTSEMQERVIRDFLAGDRDTKSEPNRKHESKPKAEKDSAQHSQPVDGIKGMGVIRANEAINCLIRIPKNDVLRKRGFQIVTDWIENNR